MFFSIALAASFALHLFLLVDALAAILRSRTGFVLAGSILLV